MLPRAVLVLVLLVSCAHAMVHMYEISLPSLEQSIATEFHEDDTAAGKRFTGFLSNSWRMMWGTGAIVAGWLVDRFGSRRLLATYLLGCSAMCAGAAMSTSTISLFTAMIAMGAFAAIYHPAGLALISYVTTPENRARALSIHGIFGSGGIGTAPLFCGAMLYMGSTWRQVYWALVVPGVVLGVVFALRASKDKDHHKSQQENANSSAEDDADWNSFAVLSVMAAIQGFVYSALMSFLPRYLSRSDFDWFGMPAESVGNLIASVVLLTGCFGQYIAGRIARAALLEWQLAWITFGNVPFLIWMAMATSWDRAVAASILALVHFMHQPIYNSLVAKYTPRRRRSLCYGLSFAMAFGLGSFGAGFAGISQSDLFVYGFLAIASTLSGTVCVVLATMNRRHGTARVS